jgi:opacity protein-like surface antigen
MKKALMLVAVLLVASGVMFGQAFKVTSVGGYLGIHGLLGPTGATEVISKGGAGMGFGPFLGVGGKVRASMASMPAVKWTGRVGYDIFQGAGSGSLKVTQGLLGIGLGAEYGLKPMMMGSKELSPYVGGEIQVNIYPAATLDGFPSGYKANSGTRIGLGLGGGVDYPLNEKMSLDVGLKLSIANLIGKGSSASDILYADAVTGTSLNEGTWMHLSLTVGVNFSLGGM